MSSLSRRRTLIFLAVGCLCAASYATEHPDARTHGVRKTINVVICVGQPAPGEMNCGPRRTSKAGGAGATGKSGADWGNQGARDAGIVRAEAPLIRCPPPEYGLGGCTAQAGPGARVMFTATENRVHGEHEFWRWRGACRRSGSNETCTLPITTDSPPVVRVIATFRLDDS